MTGVAALSAVSIPDIATAIPKTGDSAPGTGSIFDALIALLAPNVADPSGGPPQAAPQTTPPGPAAPADANTPQTIVPDAITSLESAIGEAMTALQQLLPTQPQAGPASTDTVLAAPTPVETATLPPQPADGTMAPALPRPGKKDQPGASAPANTDTSPSNSLVALALLLPSLPAAGETPAAPANPPAEDLTIGSNAKTAVPNSLPGSETKSDPQNDLQSVAGANPPVDSASQPIKGDAKAMPAQAAIPFAAAQAVDAAAALSLTSVASPSAEKPAANASDRRAQTETIARASKGTASASVSQADNAVPTPGNNDLSATADRAPGNSNGHTDAAGHFSQDLASAVIARPDNSAAPVPSNGYAAPSVANHAPIELSGIVAANNLWTDASQAGDTPLRLSLSAPGAVPDPANMDSLALRIAAKSADGDSQFQIRLDPPSLGRIEIHLNMDSQGNAQAQLSADRPQTLDALQRDSGSLERALKDAGLDLPGGLSFSLKGDGKPAAWRDAQNSSRGRAMQIDAVDAANNAAAIFGLTSAGQSWGAASMRLDIRV